MLIHKPSRQVVLKTTDADRIRVLVPEAKTIIHGGQELVVVPHTDETVRRMAPLGVAIPGPIEHYYNWPSRYDSPFSHQVSTAAFMVANKHGYVLNGMGSGKTLSTLWAFDYLKRQGMANRMLIVAPLSTLDRTWADEVFTHLPHLTVAVLHHSSMRKRVQLLAVPHDIYVVNHDGIKAPALLNAINARKDIDVLVLDELAVFRTAGTDRFKAALALAKDREYVWGLTGTPTPNAPTDVWAQCRIVTPDSVPKYYGRFRDEVMRQAGPYKWEPRDSALDVVRRVMQPAIRFSREECIDLPPTIYQTRHAPLSEEQRTAYTEMLRRLKTEYDGGQVLAVNEAVKLSKLLQIVAGVAYGRNGEEVVLPSRPRVNVVREIIDEAEGKVIVFVPYTAALVMLAEQLKDEYAVEMIYGDISKTKRNQIFSEFQRGATPRVLVADARTMSHGLTLTRANTIVWYGPTMSNDTWNQANARIVRPGQKLTTLIVRMESTPVERAVYERLQKRTSVQGVLLDMMRDPYLQCEL